MPTQPYSRPPITEAVIELRFVTPVEAGKQADLARRFKQLYPHQETIRNFGIQLQLPSNPEDEAKATTTNPEVSYRLAVPDTGEIALITPTAVAIAQLAPYPGWESLFRRFSRDWELWRGITIYRRIQRIGVRFINRLDIPFEEGKIEQDQYLTVYPQLPSELGSFLGYGVQAQLPIPDIGCNLMINTAVVPSVLINHGAILLDLDIFLEGDVPQGDEKIYDLLNRVRVKKNEVFELCVTDRARELFR